MLNTEIPWNLQPVAEHGYIIPELIEMSVDRFLLGELGFVPMVWFWVWLWLGLKRDEGNEEFYYSEQVCAFSEGEYNIAAAMNSGPSYAADWQEWVVSFPAPGYAIREASNY